MTAVPLLNALYDDERKQLGLQEKTINNQKMQQDVGRMEAFAYGE